MNECRVWEKVKITHLWRSGLRLSNGVKRNEGMRYRKLYLDRWSSQVINGESRGQREVEKIGLKAQDEVPERRVNLNEFEKCLVIGSKPT